MNLKESFSEALLSAPNFSAFDKSEDFLGRIYPTEFSSSAPLFELLSCGKLHTFSPWSFDIKSLDCFLLLYTQKGYGKLLLNSQVYSLNAGSLLLLDCSQRFRIDIAIEPWDYQVLFVGGDLLSYYRQFLSDKHYSIIPVSPYSDVVMNIEQLATKTPNLHTTQKLIISDLLCHIITRCITPVLTEEEPPRQIPSYLEEIQSLFDNHFEDVYTLGELEEQFGISKYRLCREFGAIFGAPPLQYLNRRRIEMAKHFLLTTNYKIHEVGSMVGIDNTNHFINLFKKYTDATPLEYKQRMTS